MMKQLKELIARGLVAMMLGVMVLSFAGVVSAQDSTQPSSQPAAPQQQTSTQKSTTTTTQTTVERVDPLWFVLGGIALLAIILIVVLASRGRGRDTHTHVHESTTVLKKE